jgi:hypothetical protein
MIDNDLDTPPASSPIQPVKLSLDNTIQFRCHPDIACFNRCCQYIDIQLTPYDILRLKQRLGMTSTEFLAQYTLPFEIDNQGMPGVRLRTLEDSTACPFVTQAGCSVYEDRPTACRYYALGLLSMRPQGSPTDENAYFLIKEEHCLGHQEPRTLTIREYRQEQGVELYDDLNREWRQIILKRRSSGPAVGQPSLRSYQFFFLGSYNLDGFREFVLSDKFSDVYELEAETFESLKTDEVALMQFGFRLLKQVLFGEMTIPVKDDALLKRAQQRRQQANTDPENPNSEYQGPIIV